MWCHGAAMRTATLLGTLVGVLSIATLARAQPAPQPPPGPHEPPAPPAAAPPDPTAAPPAAPPDPPVPPPLTAPGPPPAWPSAPAPPAAPPAWQPSGPHWPPAPPFGGYPPPGYPPPPGSGPPFGPPWMAGPPPPAAPSEVEGVDADGVPLSQHAGLGVETASFADGKDAAAASVVLAASVPLGSRTFFDARLPVSLPFGIVGNAMLGARHVARPLPSLWVTAGGALGVPLLSLKTYDTETYELAIVPRAAWDLHEHYPSIWPLEGRVAVEGHVGIVELRGEFDPVIYFPFIGGEGVELVIQHAFEVQVGHAIHGGLRLQGMAFPTFAKSMARPFFIDLAGEETDRYQFAMEPFFGLEQETFFLRTGMMMPLDSQLGPPFKKGWGFRLGVGFRL